MKKILILATLFYGSISAWAGGGYISNSPTSSGVATDPSTILVGNSPKTLDTSSVLTSSGSIVVQSTSASTGHFIQKWNNNSGTGLVVVQQNGSMGIGLISTGAKLDVSGGTGEGSMFRVLNGSADTIVDIGEESTSLNRCTWSNSSNSYTCQTFGSGSVGASITYEGGTGGTIGIGTTSPTSTLDVAGEVGLFSRTAAQIDALVPTKAGAVIFCSNCATSGDVCVSTGTAVAQWRRIGTTQGCGTGG